MSFVIQRFLPRFILPVVLMAKVSAATIVFSRSQTLDGWHERTFTTSWSDLEPDAASLVTTDANGDLRGFNHPTSTVWLQSPAFVLDAGGSITISQVYLMANTADAPLAASAVDGFKSAAGWGGIALGDSEGNFVFTYSAATAWAEVVFSAEDLSAFVGEELTLNFISANNSSGDFLYINRPIQVEGTLAAVPEPSAALLGCAGLALAFRRRRR